MKPKTLQQEIECFRTRNILIESPPAYKDICDALFNKTEIILKIPSQWNGKIVEIPVLIDWISRIGFTESQGKDEFPGGTVTIRFEGKALGVSMRRILHGSFVYWRDGKNFGLCKIAFTNNYQR